MWRPSRKRFWLGALVVVLAIVICSLPPVRVQYHKSRLESVKHRKALLLAATPSALDKFWLRMGAPVSGQELEAAIRKHEGALVRLRFLDQHKLPAQMVSTCPETMQTLHALQKECPWCHIETVAATNLLITACPGMLDRWRERAKKLGW